jgi:hypothetical protein
MVETEGRAVEHRHSAVEKFRSNDRYFALVFVGRKTARWILSSTVGSEPLGKFSTLLDSSTAYQHVDSYRHDPFCRVLNMELLQFYYSRRATEKLARLGAMTRS